MPEPASMTVPMKVIAFILENHIFGWASIIGVFISLIGFIVLILKVIRMKSAAKNTQNAVIAVTKDIKRIDTVSDLTAALTEMDEIKTMHLRKEFNELPKQYSKLRKKLITIRKVYPNITNQESTEIQKAILLFKQMENELIVYLYKNETPEGITTQYKRVNTLIDDLHAMLISIKNQIGRYQYEK